jgi:hypothetical protein
MNRILLLLVLCGLVACSALPGAGDSLPDLSGTWSITLTQSGGFAGLNRTVTVASDGNVTARDARTDQSGSLQLSSGELAALQQLVAASSFVHPTKTDSGCADCFLYDLQIQSPAGRASFQLNDVTLPDSGLQPLVEYLVDLMDQALATP